MPEQPRQRSVPFFGTFSEAQAAKREQQVKAVQARGAWREQRAALSSDGELSVFDYFTRWLKQSEKRLSPGTIEDRAACYRNHLHAVFGACRVVDVTAQMVEDWIDDSLTGGAKYWPIRSAFHALQAMLGEAARKRHVEWNVCTAVDLPSMPRRERRDWLTIDEYRTLLAACQIPQERLWIGLAGEAGLRRGEIAGLKPSAIQTNDSGQHVLVVSVNVVDVKGKGLVERPPKGGKTRVVGLTPTLAALLDQYIAVEHVADDAYLFTSPTDGGAMKPDSLTTWVRNVIVRAGLVNDERKAIFHLHDLRRTAASLARERGVSIEAIRVQLGHARDTMTRAHYIRTESNPHLDEFAAAMDDLTAR